MNRSDMLASAMTQNTLSPGQLHSSISQCGNTAIGSPNTWVRGVRGFGKVAGRRECLPSWRTDFSQLQRLSKRIPALRRRDESETSRSRSRIRHILRGQYPVDGRVVQASDLAGMTNTVGAPSFASFAQGGSRECQRKFVIHVAS